MLSKESLENFLIGTDLDYEEIADGIFLVRSREDDLPIVVNHSPPLLIVRMKVMDLEPGGSGREELYRTLLHLNATDVVHGAYGMEEGEIILSHTFQLDTLDVPELQAAMESIQMAASSHMGRIKTLAAQPAEG